MCDDLTESVGCGPQETFINCADVKINSNTPSRINPDYNPWQLFYRYDVPSNPSVLKTNSVAPSTTDNLIPLVVRSDEQKNITIHTPGKRRKINIDHIFFN